MAASTVNEAMVMCDVLRETLMGLGGQGESADRIEYSLSPVVSKEKEFPVQQLLYSFLMTQSTRIRRKVVGSLIALKRFG